MKMVKRKKIKSLNFIRLLIAVFLVISGGQRALAQEDYVPLNLSQVETALRSTKATPAVKNSVLIKGIGERKITFWLTPENEKKLRSWGAGEALLKAVRENAPPPFPMLLPNPKIFKNALGIELVLIPKGEFLMGLAEGDFGDANERPQHNVKIADDYYIAKYEVTQGQWKAVFGKNPSSDDKCGDDCPVENISWETVQKFITKLNEKTTVIFTGSLRKPNGNMPPGPGSKRRFSGERMTNPKPGSFPFTPTIKARPKSVLICRTLSDFMT